MSAQIKSVIRDSSADPRVIKDVEMDVVSDGTKSVHAVPSLFSNSTSGRKKKKTKRKK